MGRNSLIPQLVDQIVGLVLDGKLRPGDRIHQNNLARSLGVSVTPLRGALHVLAGEGLIRLTRGAGFSVAPLTTAGIVETTELALALEVAALRVSIPRLGADDIDALERTLDQIAQLKDSRQWYPLTWSFYRPFRASPGDDGSRRRLSRAEWPCKAGSA